MVTPQPVHNGAADARIDDRRIKMADALPLIGKSIRVAQQMAEAGEIPGAIKIRGEWTFSYAKLRAWLDDLERDQCQTRKAVAKADHRARLLATPNGSSAKRTAGRSKDASASAVASGDGAYEQAMSRLLSLGLKKTSRG